MLWRQGDVLIAQIDAIPAEAHRRADTVLAEGEITGHMHRIAEPDAAELFEHDGLQYLKVIASTATLVHDEHDPITLARGLYRFWRQREYTPGAYRTIYD